MKPLRRKTHYEVTDGRQPGDDRVLESSHEWDVLSDEGSIDSLAKRTRRPCDCGCFRQVGGRCQQCGALSCDRCHGHCARCGKPLCLECSFHTTGPHSECIRLCERCHTGTVRRRRAVRIWRAILSPFIRFRESSDDKV